MTTAAPITEEQRQENLARFTAALNNPQGLQNKPKEPMGQDMMLVVVTLGVMGLFTLLGAITAAL